MAWNDTCDRTLPASPRRRREARRQGRVWQSGDLAAALALGGIGLLLTWQGGGLVTACGDWLRQSLNASPVVRADQLGDVLKLSPLTALAGSTAGLLLSLWLIAVIVRFVQVGPLFVPGFVRPQAERVSPSAGLRRMMSAASMMRGSLWSLRLMMIGGVVWWTVAVEAGSLSGLSKTSPGELAMALGGLLTSFVWRLCGGLLVVAAIDAGWQWWSHERSLRMTAEEVRAERRESGQSPVRRVGVHASACPRRETC